jgi:tetrahydromethanopterin S-methyltransferase subunit G
MSEEQTDRLEGGTPFEIRVLRELTNLNNRLTSLEEKVETRLYDTRPIWEAVLGRLDRIEAKLDVFGRDLIETRTDVRALEKRLPAA